MDFHLKQWRDQQDESEEHQPSPAKLPRLHLQHHQEPPSDHEPALPLFLPQHPPQSSQPSTKIIPGLDSKPPLPPSTASRLPSRMGGYFSIAQWQELELQALIFRHMVAGAAVPVELLQLVKKSLLNSPSYYLNNYSYYQPALLQSAGYWGRAAMDPEPGRCRRTDGKKWRCSRDVVAGQKYCERHVHRGRNRSRKPVEFPVPAAADKSSLAAFGGGGGGGSPFSLSSPASSSSSLDIFQLNQGTSEPKPDRNFLLDPQNDPAGDGKSNGRVLRHFFDDWPRPENGGENGTGPTNSATCLSISTPAPGANPSLDFLKLSTGNGGDDLGRRAEGSRSSTEWGGGSQVAAMGGPLAEALRSSTGSSPTSVLHQLPRSAAAGTSYVTA